MLQIILNKQRSRGNEYVHSLVLQLHVVLILNELPQRSTYLLQDLLNQIQFMQLGYDEEDAERRGAAQRQRLQAEERVKDLKEVQESRSFLV